MLSPREVALRLRVTRTYVYWLARRGFLPGARRVQRGRVWRWFIPELAVAVFERVHGPLRGVPISLRGELVGPDLALEHARAFRLVPSGARWPS